MSKTIKVGVPMPKISTVKAVAPRSIKVQWLSGIRAGRVETVGLAPVIDVYKFYRPLRSDMQLFESVQVNEFGSMIYWGDKASELEMAASTVERLAEESKSSWSPTT